MEGKIILNLAMSVDGYIASNDGGFAWIGGDGDSKLNTKETHDFVKFLQETDVVVMGGDCYRQGFAKDYLEKTVYVATSQNEVSSDNVKFINGDIVEPILKEKAEGKNIFLFGGGKTVDPFIKSDVIDEYRIGIIPVILGRGRKLFVDSNPTIKLKLEKYSVAEGVVVMTYSKRDK